MWTKGICRDNRYQPDTNRTPAGYQPDTSRTPTGYQQDANRIPAGYQQDTNTLAAQFHHFPANELCGTDIDTPCRLLRDYQLRLAGKLAGNHDLLYIPPGKHLDPLLTGPGNYIVLMYQAIAFITDDACIEKGTSVKAFFRKPVGYEVFLYCRGGSRSIYHTIFRDI